MTQYGGGVARVAHIDVGNRRIAQVLLTEKAQPTGTERGGQFRRPFRVMTHLPALYVLLPALLLAQTAKPFVPADFQVPEMYISQRGTFKLKPLGPKYAKLDYDAYMSSIEHLQKNYKRLQEIKKVYDPKNRIRHVQSVRLPA